ncbi:unnamed protein product [Spirodela intermedia]|uniref:Uncharacterized protein n=1 Tax=Spirodela intermedia TaxID=51605 RepID=A0A7I8L4X3_SPIIN|nr:unnamed protein product [Spirodela intermedia]
MITSVSVRLFCLKIALSSSRLWSGLGSFPATRDLCEIRPSKRPNSTANDGPPVWTTTSLVARARMSAQETTPGHLLSTAVLALTTVSNPSPAREMFSSASFSASPFGEAIITEASHPCEIFHRRSYLDEAVVEEESERGRDGDKGLDELLPHLLSHYGLNVGTGRGVEVRPQLGFYFPGSHQQQYRQRQQSAP